MRHFRISLIWGDADGAIRGFGFTHAPPVFLNRTGTTGPTKPIRKLQILRVRLAVPMELDSSSLLQLLSRMKEEHARSAAAIEALDRSAAESSRRLEHQRETIDRMGEDVNQIVAKTLQSAGSARQVSEVRPLHPPAKVSLPSPSLARAALSRFPHVRPLLL